MHIKVEYPEAVINIREIKACIDAGDTIGEILERHLEEIDQDITIKTSADQICSYAIDRMIELNHPWLDKTMFSICSNGTLSFQPASVRRLH